MSNTVKYTTDNTSVIASGQFVTTVASTATPAKLWPGVAQIFTVQAVADVAGSLAGTYFDCFDANGLVRVYITVGGTGTIPPLYNNGRLLVVDVTADDSANTVAAAINTVIDAEAQFVSTVLNDTVTVTQAFKGERAAPAAGTSGFTVGVSTAGVSTQKLVPSASFTGKKARGTDNTTDIYLGQSSANNAQLQAISPGKTVIVRAPEGGSIDLGQFYVDVATNADGVIVNYPAAEDSTAAGAGGGSGDASAAKQDTGNASLASIDSKTATPQYSGVPSNFAIASADGTVFTLAAGEKGFIQNLSADAPLAVKKGASASTISFNFILAKATAASDGTGGAVEIKDWIGAVSVAKMAGTASYIAWKQAP